MTFSDLWFALSPVGGGLVALWGFFKLSPTVFVEKGFGHYLDRRMALLRQEHEQQNKRLGEELSYLADRGNRSNEREFQAIADAWESYLDAHERTRAAIVSFSKRADLTPLNDTDLNEYLDDAKIHQSYRRAILEANRNERNRIFGQHLQAVGVNEAGEALTKAKILSRKSSVFMPVSLYEIFERGLDLMHSAWVEKYMSSDGDWTATKESSMAFLSGNGDTNLETLRKAVRERLLRPS